MPQAQDSTHARDIRNLEQAKDVCVNLAGRYSPTDRLLEIPALTAFCADCSLKLSATYAGERAFEEARAERAPLFKGLGTFVNRVAATLKTCKASDRTVAEAKSLAADIRGQRAGKKQRPASSTAPAEEIVGQISVAQTSFDSQVEHFRKAVSLCTALGPAYTATAPELKADALTARLEALDAANRTVSTAGIDYSTALIARDRLLYHPETGIVARMAALRTHFDSAFGSTSAERKLLNGLIVRDRSNSRLAAV